MQTDERIVRAHARSHSARHAGRAGRAARIVHVSRHPRERRFLFIAGGTGIAPLRSMLWHALLAERDGHIGLIYSVRSPEEFAYMEEFQRLEDEGRIDFRHTVTRASGRRLDAAGWAASTRPAWTDLIEPARRCVSLRPAGTGR